MPVCTHIYCAARTIFASLFAAGLRFLSIVTCPQYDGDFITRTRYTIEVAAERRESAAVPPDLYTIDPNCAVVVDRLKMKQDMLSRPIRRDLHLPAIPNSIVIIGVADAGQIRFRAKGNDDLAVQVAFEHAAVDTTITLINLELPLAIQAEPIFADKLWTRIFVTG